MKKTLILIIPTITILLIILLIHLVFFDDKSNDKTRHLIQEWSEEVYFKAQKDAINGDIRIKKVNDSTYIWIKSPWNDGRDPIFYPSTK